MDSGKQQRWNNRGGRSSYKRKPPRDTCNWHSTVPSWEKLFCEAVGNLDWETLMQMKKCMHFYENVIQWDDSAGEEAFCNAKKRFWARINGLPCDISLPDPDLYIDEINWDSVIDPQLLNQRMTSSTEEHEDGPVIIFGDALLPSQEYPVIGWGDDEDNFMVPVDSHVDTWEQNLGDLTGAPTGWDDDLGISNSNNNVNHEVGPGVEYKISDVEQGTRHEDYVAWADAEKHVSSYSQANDHYRNQTSRTYENRRKGKRWGKQSGTEKRGSSFNSWGRRNNSRNNVEPK